MRILHVHSGNMFGGVERMLETLAPENAGTAPVHSSFALCFDGRVGQTLRAAGADVHSLGPVHVRRPDEIWRARRALRELLVAGPWNAVMVHSAWSQGVFGPTILKQGLPLVRWLHAPQSGPAWLERLSARARPALVLCNSRYTLDAARKRVGDAPMAVCYPPAQPSSAGVQARADVRRDLGTDPDTIVMVIAARMEAWKGHETFLASLGMLSPGCWEAWIAGGPQRHSEERYYEALRSTVRNGGLSSRVRFLGQRSDVARILQAADIYCQPNSGAEPFGLSFVEALAAGLPVVTTGMGAAPEIVDARCGVLVQPGSPRAVADALRNLIENGSERQAMGAAARVRAQEFCDLPRSLTRLSAELARVASPSRIPALT